jgi:peptidoglycan/LPS O-acetylase OafA/YrhL
MNNQIAPEVRQNAFQPSRLNLLTFGRFLAAMGVVIFHSGHSALLHINGEVAHFASSGYVYVGFFYVLSGFVLTYAFMEKKLQVRDFLVARLARIYPAYAFALALMIPPFLLRIHQGEYPLKRLVASLVTVPLLMQAWLPLTAQAWNYPAWSVSAEFFFYLSFPFALIKMRKIGSASGKVTASHIQFILLLWVISLVPCILYVFLNPDKGLTHKAAEMGWLSVLCFSPLLRLPEFLAGISVAIIASKELSVQCSDQVRTSLCSGLIVAGGLMGIVLVLAFKPAAISDPILHNGLLMPLWAALIYGLVRIEMMSVWLAVPSFLTLLGEASYGIYILQTPVSNAFKFLIRAVTGQSIEGDYDSPWLLFAYCVLLILISILSFKYVETPMRLLIRSLFSSPSPNDPVITRDPDLIQIKLESNQNPQDLATPSVDLS